ncbi:MAG TPA: FAD-binding oxidoreductase [Steroidobacteraceae bacterium]|jgi:4-cresol dehydrogenase (hydroxylating)|nr:FAD-binding oxidoreductase [Steroidobacteraceae bacterium]
MADTVLPPGLSESRARAALRRIEAITGADYVFTTDLDRQTYADKFAIDDTQHLPLGAVAPATVEEIRAIVRVASEYKLPLWPISRGKNLGYGGSAPRLSGSLVLDLSRMKRIEVDEENGTVLLEPGVGFYDLYDHLQSRGIKLWLSVPGNSWGSVVGNALDRGAGYTTYGEHASKICGMEVVLPDGDLVRTGMGALANSQTWQLYRYGFGPCWDQLFCQSNFGIVTKMGLWLMPEPESVMGLDLEFDKPEDLGPLIDTLGPLRREGLLQQSPTIGNWLRAAAVVTTRDQWTKEPGALSDAVIDAIRKKFGMGWWGVSLRLYGREGVNREALAVLEKAMTALGPSSLKRTSWRQGEPLEQTGWVGVPLTFPMQNANWHGGRGGHIGFSPVLPQSGKLAMEQFRRTYQRYKEFGMDYQASFAIGERHMLNINAILFNKDDPAMMKRVDPFVRTLIADAKAHGYGEYRTHLDYMDTVAATYDFNNHALLRLNERVKDALDPAGILAPGKSGVWPSAYRKERRA